MTRYHTPPRSAFGDLLCDLMQLAWFGCTWGGERLWYLLTDAARAAQRWLWRRAR